MSQSNQTDNPSGKYQSANNKAVVDITKYQNLEDKISSERAAFDQVMSQMNIADRHTFEVQYERAWQQASDKRELLSLLICEIDFFKAYFDKYGYQGSAFMLLVISLALKNTCEKFDCYLAHYQGGEFAVIIKGGDVETAEEVAEALRLAVEESHTEHKFSEVSDVVTLSIGISSIYPTTMDTLFQKSTHALQSAKKTGHNRFFSNVELKIKQNGFADNTSELKDSQESGFERSISQIHIYNRREFNHYFVNAWQESTTNKELLSMVIGEVDFFNDYEQHYGQENSEEILLLVACTLKSKCEEFGCFIAHLEEQKFVILIKGGNATKGLKIAKTLHESIKDLAMVHAYSPIQNRLTMSFGLSNILPTDENTMKSLMLKVDNALRDAKSSGYDQIKVC
ncbi:diguanylate cyclase [Psychromonas sp. MME2]|uniref:diguanylate cyclase domain-containing protein n=1 Tax=unclassified Psychromonas TaxID=2614957 RepID=UPI00339CFCB3